MKKKLIVVLITIISLGLSSCYSTYTCPATFQIPSNMKSIPTDSRRWEVNKIWKDSQKLQKKTVEKSTKRRKGKYSYRK